MATFFFHSASAFFLLGLILAVLSRSAGLPQTLYWRSLRPINVLALFTIVTGALVNHPGSSFLEPSFSWEGLRVGGLYAARLVTITLITTLFLLTTEPRSAVNFGIRVLKPLRLLGIQQQELSLLVHLAYRFVPLLRREIQEVDRGRRARNLPPPKGLRAKTKEGLDIIIFLFVGSLHRAETTAFALEQRRVLENWNLVSEKNKPGLGGWMSILLIASTVLLLWGDPFLL